MFKPIGHQRDQKGVRRSPVSLLVPILQLLFHLNIIVFRLIFNFFDWAERSVPNVISIDFIPFLLFWNWIEFAFGSFVLIVTKIVRVKLAESPFLDHVLTLKCNKFNE